MKKQIWLVFVASISTSLFAQTNAPESTSPVATPPPAMTVPAPAAVEPAPAATNAPAKKKIISHKKRKLAAAEAAMVESPVTLVPGPAEVSASNINVRGQAGLKGEVIAHLTAGDTVTVLEQINLHKHKADEPAQWARIAFPTNASVWVNTKYIDAVNKTVLPKRLNLRAGPGENYSIVGLVERGTTVSEILNKGKWAQIEAPTNAYAFVAAMYLKQEALAAAPANAAPPMETGPAPAPQPAETMPAPAPTTVAEAQPVVTEPTNAPVALEMNAAPAAATETNAAPAAAVDTNAPAAAVEQTPPPPRVVTHEGFVRHVTSVIEPTAYELYEPSTDVAIDYLYTTTTNLDLSRYNGLHIIVTGEEGLAARWNETPVLTIQRILVVPDANAVPRFQSVSPNKGHHN
jgi:uncharacterized protein YgiM (DUF1202 family)